MNGAVAPPEAPTPVQRLAIRARPERGHVMYQQWRDLLFLHWEYPAGFIQQRLPEGLFVDTFQGKAYLGVVPFFMRNIRPRFLPALPGISDFMEMNVRTYVYDRSGVPGVWFYSLDANRRLAVALARRFFHLPYEHARMQADRTGSGTIRYRWLREGARSEGEECFFQYAAGEVLPPLLPDSLEFFLVERYRLYAASKGRLWRGAVAHGPYPLFRAEVTAWNEQALALNRFSIGGRPPDHIVMSSGVDVRVHPLERV